jgi:ABC-type sugar transport system ATPase subunit
VAAIQLRAVEKTFPNGYRAIRGVDLTIADGEFLVLVGPSGCGKSTLLRLIAGLEMPDTGTIAIDGADVTRITPGERDLAMVFQSYALYPHMTVRENLAYGLKVRGTDPRTIAGRVADAARALGLEPQLDWKPAQLSGGQRQRVALGRAMVRRPRAFLLDEPLSNLDPGLRAQARVELRRLHGALGATVVYVTHDQEEAMTLGDRIAVMRDGSVEQIGTPAAVYERPVNTFVARFIGEPPMNLVPARLLTPDAPADATAGIRPHDVVLAADAGVRGIVELVQSRGHDSIVDVRLPEAGGTTIAAVVRSAAPSAGAEVAVTVPPDRLHMFDGAGRRTAD